MRAFGAIFILILSLSLWSAAWADGAADARFSEAVAAYRGGAFSKAASLWRPLAEAGDAEARYRLGRMYEDGKGVARDAAEAVRWYHPAAEAGHARAQVALGVCYRLGRGVAKDPVQGAAWFHKAAEQGDEWGQYAWGLWLGYTEDGPAPYRAGATIWFEKAAAQGLAEAQFEMGEFWNDGGGHRPHVQSAVAWYRKAVAQGYPEAMVRLALILDGFPRIDGDEYPTDRKQAFDLYLMAAERGHPIGQLSAGEMLLRGEVVEKDPVEALKWWELARPVGKKYIGVGRLFAEAEGRSPSDVLAEARRRAAAWKPVATWRKPLVPPPPQPWE